MDLHSVCARSEGAESPPERAGGESKGKRDREWMRECEGECEESCVLISGG